MAFLLLWAIKGLWVAQSCGRTVCIKRASLDSCLTLRGLLTLSSELDEGGALYFFGGIAGYIERRSGKALLVSYGRISGKIFSRCTARPVASHAYWWCTALYTDKYLHFAKTITK